MANERGGCGCFLVIILLYLGVRPYGVFWGHLWGVWGMIGGLWTHRDVEELMTQKDVVHLPRQLQAPPIAEKFLSRTHDRDRQRRTPIEERDTTPTRTHALGVSASTQGAHPAQCPSRARPGP